MKIALISVHYPPLRSSCAIQMRDLAQELLLQGHEPIVIVPTESINKAWTNEIVDGVMVFRLAAFKTINVGFFRRALNEVLLPLIMLYNLRKSSFPRKELNAIVWYSPTIFFVTSSIVKELFMRIRIARPIFLISLASSPARCSPTRFTARKDAHRPSAME